MEAILLLLASVSLVFFGLWLYKKGWKYEIKTGDDAFLITLGCVILLIGAYLFAGFISKILIDGKSINFYIFRLFDILTGKF